VVYGVRFGCVGFVLVGGYGSLLVLAKIVKMLVWWLCVSVSSCHGGPGVLSSWGCMVHVVRHAAWLEEIFFGWLGTRRELTREGFMEKSRVAHDEYKGLSSFSLSCCFVCGRCFMRAFPTLAAGSLYLIPFLYFHASITSFWVHHYGVIISSFIHVFCLFPYSLGAKLLFPQNKITFLLQSQCICFFSYGTHMFCSFPLKFSGADYLNAKVFIFYS